jgi:hypothetical protein
MEAPMGEAEDLTDYLMSHPLTPEEKERGGRPLGKLRLSERVTSASVDKTTRVQHILKYLREHPNDPYVALTEPDVGAAAVIMTVDAYVELVEEALKTPPPEGYNELVMARAGVLPSYRVEEVTPDTPSAAAEPPGRPH